MCRAFTLFLTAFATPTTTTSQTNLLHSTARSHTPHRHTPQGYRLPQSDSCSTHAGPVQPSHTIDPPHWVSTLGRYLNKSGLSPDDPKARYTTCAEMSSTSTIYSSAKPAVKLPFLFLSTSLFSPAPPGQTMHFVIILSVADPSCRNVLETRPKDTGQEDTYRVRTSLLTN